MNGRAWKLVLAAGIWLLPAASQNPVFQAGTRIVAVAVVAKDSQDAPVTNLSADDFQLFDNGVEQKILSFDRLWDPPRAADGLPVGLPPNRPSVILLDALHTAWIHQPYVREALAGMLRNLPQTVDRIEILSLGDRIGTVHRFSPFTMALRTAVEEYGGEQPAMPEGNWPFWTLKALTNIAQELKAIPGEKNLIWVADGFSLGSDYREAAEAMRKLADARVMLYMVYSRGLMLKPTELQDFAELTGGRALYDSNDLAALLRTAIDDSREGFLLTYSPNGYREDGSAHEVKVKTGSKGVELRYRPGYTADFIQK